MYLSVQVSDLIGKMWSWSVGDSTLDILSCWEDLQTEKGPKTGAGRVTAGAGVEAES